MAICNPDRPIRSPPSILPSAVLETFMRDSGFALKGGSVLNSSIRDLPRLSVDIDIIRCDYCE